jgi:hypothetical protein
VVISSGENALGGRVVSTLRKSYGKGAGGKEAVKTATF